MTSLIEVIRVRTGGGVRRCHGIRHHGEYRVDSHSWGVAVLMLLLWPEDFPRLAAVCLVHDVPEAWVGDAPAPTKRYSPEVKRVYSELERLISRELGIPYDGDLSPEDKEKLKTCDLLELYLWAAEQVYGGNNHARCILREVERFVAEVPLPERAAAIMREIQEHPEHLEHATDGVIHRLLGDKT